MFIIYIVMKLVHKVNNDKSKDRFISTFESA